MSHCSCAFKQLISIMKNDTTLFLHACAVTLRVHELRSTIRYVTTRTTVHVIINRMDRKNKLVTIRAGEKPVTIRMGRKNKPVTIRAPQRYVKYERTVSSRSHKRQTTEIIMHVLFLLAGGLRRWHKRFVRSSKHKYDACLSEYFADVQ